LPELVNLDVIKPSWLRLILRPVILLIFSRGETRQIDEKLEKMALSKQKMDFILVFYKRPGVFEAVGGGFGSGALYVGGGDTRAL